MSTSPEPQAPARTRKKPDPKVLEENKRQREAERFLEDVAADVDELTLDAALAAAENFSQREYHEAVSRMTPAEAAAHLHRLQAERQDEFVSSFMVDSRRALAWAVRRVREAEDELDRTKAAMQAEVSRLERRFERREEMLAYKIEGFARSIPPKARDSDIGIRVPEAAMRIELRDKKGGWKVLDSGLAMSALALRLGLDVLEAAAGDDPMALMNLNADEARRVGMAELVKRGVVEIRHDLHESRAKALAADLVAKHAARNGGAVIDIEGMVDEPHIPEGKMVLVRTHKETTG